MKIFKQLFAFSLCTLSTFVFAAGGSTSTGEVTAITIYKGHTGILVNHTVQIDPDNCGRKDYYILPDTHPYFKEAYSLLLASRMAGQKVILVVEGCHQGIPAIKHIVN